MSMVSRGVKAFLSTPANTSGKIPPAPTKATYTTADFATSQAPENTGKEPSLQGETTLEATMKNVGEAYPVPPMPKE